MKKIISLALSFVILFSCAFANAVPSYSANKPTVQATLDNIQKQTGFIPNKTAAVTGNCYAFVSMVCQKLYGVEYKEGLYENYKVKQQTGNYYTVATMTYPKTTPDSDFAQKVFEFFTNYAVSGDVVHYGAFNSNYSKTHTVMIYYVDKTKMQIYHSNYGDNNCRLDTIYWDSFFASPTKSTSNSLNAIFYNSMKAQNAGGLGITISRYKKYTNLYSMPPTNSSANETSNAEPVQNIEPPKQVTDVKITSRAVDNIYFSWSKVDDAVKYYIYVTNDTKNTNFDKVVTTTSTSIKGLTPGNVYTIRIKAYNGEWGEYSAPLKTASKPNQPSITSITTPKKKKITVKWKKVADSASGYQIYYSKDKSFKTGVVVKTTSGKSKVTSSATGLKSGKKYYVKVRAFKTVSNTKIYSPWSKKKSITVR